MFKYFVPSLMEHIKPPFKCPIRVNTTYNLELLEWFKTNETEFVPKMFHITTTETVEVVLTAFTRSRGENVKLSSVTQVLDVEAKN
jgi:hypothetical protein